MAFAFLVSLICAAVAAADASPGGRTTDSGVAAPSVQASTQTRGEPGVGASTTVPEPADADAPARPPRSWKTSLTHLAAFRAIAAGATKPVLSALEVGVALVVFTAGIALWVRQHLTRRTAIIRRQLEQECALETRYRELFDGASDFVFMCDPGGRIIALNAAGERLTSCTRDAGAGRPASSLFVPEHSVDVHEMLQRIARARRRALFEADLVDADGARRAFEVDAGPVVRDGRLIGIQAIARDITERKRYERDLELARAEAEAAGRARSEFVANVSDAIRAPLNDVLGLSDRLLATGLDAAQRKYACAVRSSAESVLHMMDDVVDLARIDAGRLELRRDPFDLHQTVDSTLRSFAATAHRQGLELSYLIDRAVPRRVVGDSDRLRQILVNLLQKALKRTGTGWIDVHVGVEGPPERGTCLLRFTVRDTGDGMPAGETRAIFDPFAQVDGSMTCERVGDRLALAIASSLVASMGGEIGIESEPGSGTTFTFTLRVGLAPREETDRADEPALRGVHALVVDDADPARLAIKAMLEQSGARVRAASAVVDALAQVNDAAAEGTPFSAVILDAELPADDCAVLVSAARRAACCAAPVVVLTALAVEDAARKLADALGPVVWVRKPLSPGELAAALSGAAQTTPAAGGVALSPSIPSGPQLVIEAGLA